MNIIDPFLLYPSIILLALVALVYVIVLNVRYFLRQIETPDFKVIAVQMLTFSIWLIILKDMYVVDRGLINFYNAIFFFMAVIFGVILIRTTFDSLTLEKQRHALQMQYENAHQRIRDIDTRKTQFISLTSHQLRGPLSAIKGYASMILEGDFGRVTKKMEDPLMKIYESSLSLGLLINDFLSVSQIEQGEVVYDTKRIDVTSVLDAVIDEFAISFEKNGIEVKRTYDTSENIMVNVDIEKIHVVFAKIIDNALRYTPSGVVTISIARKNNDVLITIKDTGIGISKDDMTHMFKKFTRTHNAAEIFVHGSGLGLYVAKEMIEAQDGKLWVDSPGLGLGATFHVALPMVA
jgi:signal transduction histidine kinase